MHVHYIVSESLQLPLPIHALKSPAPSLLTYAPTGLSVYSSPRSPIANFPSPPPSPKHPAHPSHHKDQLAHTSRPARRRDDMNAFPASRCGTADYVFDPQHSLFVTPSLSPRTLRLRPRSASKAPKLIWSSYLGNGDHDRLRLHVPQRANT
ncbi:hypothetical protein M427DRAFT_225720 [Gonapodya prolifera JEL478]|uniref:Uncharacterized protein n=1 Tax=Gonapodya prolifera (strain JEL478) TaxID=1344416 RepID=A0A139AND4_GONPJ|nr:hypothetical protein M427DRAFT_225720 [Gonapodya prolifera JEL478]|eukprot:KXS18261.1 hypothetical protein M427DRAFT_225720 [Gonapodya prolifera JEL478]